MAGTGNTIAMSTFINKDLLVGTLFCTHQIPACRDYHLLIPTLAYQLAKYSEGFAASLRDVLSIDPDIPAKKPDMQVTALLIKTWKSVIESGKMGVCTPVMIIDDLDECENVSLVLKPLISVN